MKVILLKDIAKLGKRGEIKEVAEGYGMNVLVKKGDALHATSAVLSQWNAKESAKNHKKELETSSFLTLTDAISRATITITGKKSDTKGQLFAQIKDTDIADAIFSSVGYSINPKQISITHPIKTLGMHTFVIKQGDKKVTLEVTVG